MVSVTFACEQEAPLSSLDAQKRLVVIELKVSRG